MHRQVCKRQSHAISKHYTVIRAKQLQGLRSCDYLDQGGSRLLDDSLQKKSDPALLASSLFVVLPDCSWRLYCLDDEAMSGSGTSVSKVPLER